MLFRDIIYFPLTQRYAGDEFDWFFDNEGKVLAIAARDVVWENPNSWNTQKESGAYFYGNAGPISVLFPFRVKPGASGIPVMSHSTMSNLQISEFMNDIQIQIYSQSDHPIEIEDLQLQYQVNQDVNGQDEVVYRLVLPTINVKMEPHSLMTFRYPIDFWKPSMHGNYWVDYNNWNLVIHYRELDTGMVQTIGTDSNYNGQRTDSLQLYLK